MIISFSNNILKDVLTSTGTFLAEDDDIILRDNKDDYLNMEVEKISRAEIDALFSE